MNGKDCICYLNIYEKAYSLFLLIFKSRGNPWLTPIFHFVFSKFFYWSMFVNNIGDVRVERAKQMI